MVAGRYHCHCASHPFDDACPLMSKHRRDFGRPKVPYEQISMANPARDHTDKYLAGSRLRELRITYYKRGPSFVHNSRFDSHTSSFQRNTRTMFAL